VKVLSFHMQIMHAPMTGKARRPTEESLTTGTNRLSVVEDRDGMSAVRVNNYYYYLTVFT